MQAKSQTGRQTVTIFNNRGSKTFLQLFFHPSNTLTDNFNLFMSLCKNQPGQKAGYFVLLSVCPIV